VYRRPPLVCLVAQSDYCKATAAAAAALWSWCNAASVCSCVDRATVCTGDCSCSTSRLCICCDADLHSITDLSRVNVTHYGNKHVVNRSVVARVTRDTGMISQPPMQDNRLTTRLRNADTLSLQSCPLSQTLQRLNKVANGTYLKNEHSLYSINQDIDLNVC